jgi:hypothetical protein
LDTRGFGIRSDAKHDVKGTEQSSPDQKSGGTRATTRSVEICRWQRLSSADTGAIKVGVVGAKTAPPAPGAAVTHFPAWRLWAHRVNEAGGMKLKAGSRKVAHCEAHVAFDRTPVWPKTRSGIAGQANPGRRFPPTTTVMDIFR